MSSSPFTNFVLVSTGVGESLRSISCCFFQLRGCRPHRQQSGTFLLQRKHRDMALQVLVRIYLQQLTYSLNKCPIHSFCYSILLRCLWYGELMTYSFFLEVGFEFSRGVLSSIVSAKSIHLLSTLIFYKSFPLTKFLKDLIFGL